MNANYNQQQLITGRCMPVVVEFRNTWWDANWIARTTVEQRRIDRIQSKKVVSANESTTWGDEDRIRLPFVGTHFTTKRLCVWQWTCEDYVRKSHPASFELIMRHWSVFAVFATVSTIFHGDRNAQSSLPLIDCELQLFLLVIIEMKLIEGIIDLMIVGKETGNSTAEGDLWKIESRFLSCLVWLFIRREKEWLYLAVWSELAANQFVHLQLLAGRSTYRGH